jgi:hypothetical protein
VPHSLTGSQTLKKKRRRRRKEEEKEKENFPKEQKG